MYRLQYIHTVHIPVYESFFKNKFEAMDWSGMVEDLRGPTGSDQYNLDQLIGHGTYGDVYIGINCSTGSIYMLLNIIFNFFNI